MDILQEVKLLREELKEVRAFVKMPTEEFVSIGKALNFMQFDRSEDWLRKILTRANYAKQSHQECSIQEGVHYTYIDKSWMVNWRALGPVLRMGSELVLPEIPHKDYAA